MSHQHAQHQHAQHQPNGEKPSSVTLHHIISYPLISDGLYFYKNNALGAKSIELAESAYSTFAAPVLPYLETPYSMVSPYLHKADALGDDALNHVDHRFPALKKTDFATVRDNARAAAGYPFRVAGDGYEYVYNTYDDEYKKKAKSGQAPIVVASRAVIGTELRIAAEAMRVAADWIGPRVEQAENEAQRLKKKSEEKAQKAKKAANEQVNHN